MKQEVEKCPLLRAMGISYHDNYSVNDIDHNAPLCVFVCGNCLWANPAIKWAIIHGISIDNLLTEPAVIKAVEQGECVYDTKTYKPRRKKV